MEKKGCSGCEYFRIDEEYFFDHYRIPARYYCVRTDRLNGKDVDSSKGCKHYVERNAGKK